MSPATRQPGPARWSILAVDTASGDVILEHDPDLLLPTASVGKLFLLHHLAELIDADPSVGRQLLRKDAVAPVADSGLWQHLDAASLTVGDCARLVGAVSDNLATNVLLDHVGIAAVQAVAERLAAGGSTLLDSVRDVRRPEGPPMLSTGCASDWVAYFREPHPTVLSWLAPATDLSMLSSAFGLDPLAHTEPSSTGPVDGLRVWSKTGTDDGVRAEVGLLEVGYRRAAYAAICRFEGEVGPVLARMRAHGEQLLEALRPAGGVLSEARP
ncbi:beta-lactamase class A [Nocardioides albertanoniae]|uniref:Beta-lactamase class A n=1 Tax=Nocardioides albertanoniae TaxID=1175486 RepID=A0A543A2R8_9ACTN|nr:serine hydrolase [Nocardioides albertanoniae]TQL66874.1 beta-lactamase class A [Nocardioides albertanoniae]